MDTYVSAAKTVGQGPDIVFIQGAGLHGDGWQPQTETLRERFRCLTFNNRTLGPITVEQMAADTVAVMDSAGIAKAHIVGHSLGGVVAQQMAVTYPERVRSLALLCTSAVGADGTRMSGKLLWLGIRSRVGTRAMRRLAFLEIVMPPEYLATLDRVELATALAPLFGHDLGDSPPYVMRQLGALKRFNGTDGLRTLDAIPTLVVSAEHDLIFPPRCGKALANQIPGATYLEIAGAGHGVPIQSPELVNSALAKHFARALKARPLAEERSPVPLQGFAK